MVGGSDMLPTKVAVRGSDILPIPRAPPKMNWEDTSFQIKFKSTSIVRVRPWGKAP